MKTFYTDYPFACLGDEPRRAAPVREIAVISCDGNKCDVRVKGARGIYKESVKITYIYTDPTCEVVIQPSDIM